MSEMSEMSESSDEYGPVQSVPGFWAYNRFYGANKPEKYLRPIDVEEINRMDVVHKSLLLVRDHALFNAPLNVAQNRPLRILDLGTGSGIWAFNLTERTAVPPHIMIVDLHPIQPELIPVGVTTYLFDIEEPSWDALMKDCDLVHIRLLYGSIQTHMWPHVYRKSLEHLTPGSGYIEHVEIDWEPKWDGGVLPRNSAILEWSQLLLESLDRCNKNARVNSAEVRQALDRAGFVDIREEIVRCHLSPWCTDEKEKRAARWFNVGFFHGLDGMSLMPMIERLNMTLEEVVNLCERVQRETCVLRYHAYLNLHVWSARRPIN